MRNTPITGLLLAAALACGVGCASKTERFFAALDRGDVATVEAMLRDDPELAKSIHDGDLYRSPLHHVALLSWNPDAPRLVELLLANGADPEAPGLGTAIGVARKDPRILAALLKGRVSQGTLDWNYVAAQIHLECVLRGGWAYTSPAPYVTAAVSFAPVDVAHRARQSMQLLQQAGAGSSGQWPASLLEIVRPSDDRWRDAKDPSSRALVDFERLFLGLTGHAEVSAFVARAGVAASSCVTFVRWNVFDDDPRPSIFVIDHNLKLLRTGTTKGLHGYPIHLVEFRSSDARLPAGARNRWLAGVAVTGELFAQQDKTADAPTFRIGLPPPPKPALIRNDRPVSSGEEVQRYTELYVTLIDWFDDEVDLRAWNLLPEELEDVEFRVVEDARQLLSASAGVQRE
ncbi:MAG: hypothetical protein WD042_13530 [Phycisphaeraceae bacterium]